MPIIVETPNETQTTTGVFALRILLRDAEKFAWQWARPTDFKDVLSTEVGGLRIELIRHPQTDDDLLLLRYGGDCCGVVQVKTGQRRDAGCSLNYGIRLSPFIKNSAVQPSIGSSACQTSRLASSSIPTEAIADYFPAPPAASRIV